MSSNEMKRKYLFMLGEPPTDKQLALCMALYEAVKDKAPEERERIENACIASAGVRA